MKRRSADSHAMLNITLSYLISAKTNKQAVEKVKLLINENSILLDRITLVNETGTKIAFTVDRIKFIEWSHAVYSDYSHQFKAFGQISMAIRYPGKSDLTECESIQASYQLPRSIIDDKAILVIPTWSQPAFTHVISQSLEWRSDVKEAVAFVKVG